MLTMLCLRIAKEPRAHMESVFHQGSNLPNGQHELHQGICAALLELYDCQIQLDLREFA